MGSEEDGRACGCLHRQRAFQISDPTGRDGAAAPGGASPRPEPGAESVGRGAVGAALKALSRRIGQADVAFTMKQYVQTDLEADPQVATTLAELIGGALASAEITSEAAARTRKERLDPWSVHKSVHKQHAEAPPMIGRGL